MVTSTTSGQAPGASARIEDLVQEVQWLRAEKEQLQRAVTSHAVVDQAIGSAAGLQAGRRAGARCFAVGRAARTPALSRLAERTVEDLAQAPVVGPAEASRRRAGTGAGAAG
ncbi:hypothetical protein ACGFZB_24345 [Streptomyces cinerochromogenes]|uniref:Uncharacterized protein n=1 Tax=Streptomyces cinerochromogenes TaxID=66422 RepID=A0ABW7B8Q2_9ACTN